MQVTCLAPQKKLVTVHIVRLTGLSCSKSVCNLDILCFVFLKVDFKLVDSKLICGIMRIISNVVQGLGQDRPAI